MLRKEIVAGKSRIREIAEQGSPNRPKMGGWGFLCFGGNRLLAKSPEVKIKRNQNRPERKSTKIKIVLAKIVKMKIAQNQNHPKRKSSPKEIVPQEEKRK